MALFLSAEWFAQLDRAHCAGAGDLGPRRSPEGAGLQVAPGPGLAAELGAAELGAAELGAAELLAVEIIVAGTPAGELRYQVVVEGEEARVIEGEALRPRAQVSIASDYATISGIASGRLSASVALATGRAKLSGDASALFALAGCLAGLDLLAPALRSATTF